MQAREQEELTDEEKARLFVQLLEKRRKHFAAKRAEEKRNRPPTRAQQRSIMCTYLKNMKGWRPKNLKNKSFANIQELLDKAMKRVNTFVDYRTELVKESSKKAEAETTQESSSKRAGEELKQESSNKQKMEDEKEKAEFLSLIEVVPDEEEVAVNVIPLATKPPSIVDWKIHKEGQTRYYQITRANGSSKMYLGRIIRIKRLLDDLGVSASKLMLLVQKLLLLVLKVNATGIKVTTAKRLQLLEEFMLTEKRSKTYQRKDKDCLKIKITYFRVASGTSTDGFVVHWLQLLYRLQMCLVPLGFRMILLGYTSALHIADVFGCLSAYCIAVVFGCIVTREALQILRRCLVLVLLWLVCMHLFGLLQIETSSSIKSALWEAPLLFVFSFCIFYVWRKSMYTAAALVINENRLKEEGSERSGKMKGSNVSWYQEPKFLIKMPLMRNMNINDVYERIMSRMEERLDQFVDQFADRMNDMMDPKRCGDRNGRRSEDEESKNPFFKGDGSSLFAEPEEWEDDGVADDDYKESLVFDDDQYEDVIDEEEGFVDNYPNFQEDENNVSCSGVVLGLEVESMPVYDTDIEDVIEEEEGFVGKGGFGGEEDNIEDVVVVANDLCSSMIQTTLSVDFSKTVDSNLHELIWLQKGNFVEVSILIGKKYQEEYLKAAPIDDKLRFKMIKVSLLLFTTLICVISLFFTNQLVSEPGWLGVLGYKLPPEDQKLVRGREQ
ncbi:hypothetical protein Tco_0709862, partial [Tanacetum coccineum]